MNGTGLTLRERLNLSYVPRWVIVPMVRQQTVTDHCWRVAVITHHLWDALGFDNEEFRVAATVDAVFHDILEALTGDIPSTQKTHTPAKSLDHFMLVVKAAELIEAKTWIRMWGHPAIAGDIEASMNMVYQDVVAEITRRGKPRAKAIMGEVIEEIGAYCGI